MIWHEIPRVLAPGTHHNSSRILFCPQNILCNSVRTSFGVVYNETDELPGWGAPQRMRDLAPASMDNLAENSFHNLDVADIVMDRKSLMIPSTLFTRKNIYEKDIRSSPLNFTTFAIFPVLTLAY